MSSRPVSASICVLGGGDVEVLEVEILLAAERRHRGVDLLDRLLHGALQLVVLDHHGLDREAGLELDLVDRVQDGRVGDRDVQPLAALDQRQYAVLGEQLVADEADDVEVEADRVEVEQRHAEFLRGGNGDVARGGHVVGDQPADEVRLALAGARDRVEHRGLVHQAVLHEPLRQARKHGPHRPGGDSVIVQRPAPRTAAPCLTTIRLTGFSRVTHRASNC